MRYEAQCLHPCPYYGPIAALKKPVRDEKKKNIIFMFETHEKLYKLV